MCTSTNYSPCVQAAWSSGSAGKEPESTASRCKLPNRSTAQAVAHAFVHAGGSSSRLVNKHAQKNMKYTTKNEGKSVAPVFPVALHASAGASAPEQRRDHRREGSLGGQERRVPGRQAQLRDKGGVEGANCWPSYRKTRGKRGGGRGGYPVWVCERLMDGRISQILSHAHTACFVYAVVSFDRPVGCIHQGSTCFEPKTHPDHPSCGGYNTIAVLLAA